MPAFAGGPLAGGAPPGVVGFLMPTFAGGPFVGGAFATGAFVEGALAGTGCLDGALVGAFVKGCAGALAGAGRLSAAFAGGAGALEGVPGGAAAFFSSGTPLPGALAEKGEPFAGTFFVGALGPALTGGAPGGDGFFKLKVKGCEGLTRCVLLQEVLQSVLFDVFQGFTFLL